MTLGDLFCAKKQLLVYHFMFGPGWGDGCPNCSFWADHFDSVNLHIGQRDTAFAVVSRAPWKEIAPFKKRMGWRFKWVSSFNTDFNLDFNVSFVEELAADIFMDDFSPKFTKAAKQAATVIEGTLYSRYYDVDCATLLSLPEAKPEPTRRSWFGRNREKPANPFAALCIQRADADESKRWDVARNGMVVEQAQILTTHNLALLFGRVGLGETLRSDLRDMSERCFRWICRRQQVKSDKWHAKLIMLKQTAYAWRQMIFYASLLAPEVRQAFIVWAEGHLHEQPSDFRARFAPALRGLVLANEGRSLDKSTDPRRFLG